MNLREIVCEHWYCIKIIQEEFGISSAEPIGCISRKLNKLKLHCRAVSLKVRTQNLTRSSSKYHRK
jgi:hypothetical protein